MASRQPAGSHQIGGRTTSFTVVSTAAWPRRWEQVGGATSAALLPVIGTVWARKTLASEAWRRQLVSVGRLRSLGLDFGVGVTYDGSSRGRQFHHRSTLQRGASATATATGGTSGAGRTVSTKSQSTAVETTVVLGFLG
ncbi:hypothetical protein V6N13_125114 [Hibiscus sabdariffa]|uniref:Uncharacterized protein n=1 Tax=Hibiscus sabdariffa TaxID=183260 RepID=A0ABR2U539_9ROSI